MDTLGRFLCYLADSGVEATCLFKVSHGRPRNLLMTYQLKMYDVFKLMLCEIAMIQTNGFNY